MANKTNHFCKYQIDGVSVRSLLKSADYMYFIKLVNCFKLTVKEAFKKAKETENKGKGTLRDYPGIVHNRTKWQYKGKFITDIFPDHNDRANFYRNLHKKEMSIADAFRRAKATQIERELKIEEWKKENEINKDGKDPD